MNRQIDEVVAEVTCLNPMLDENSTFRDFEAWIDQMRTEGFDRSEYPNFNAYARNPAQYWPFIERMLKVAA